MGTIVYIRSPKGQLTLCLVKLQAVWLKAERPFGVTLPLLLSLSWSWTGFLPSIPVQPFSPSVTQLLMSDHVMQRNPLADKRPCFFSQSDSDQLSLKCYSVSMR